MKVNQRYQVEPAHEIMALTHENKKVPLIKSLGLWVRESYRVYPVFKELEIWKLDLYLNNEQGERLKTYYFEYDTSKFEKPSRRRSTAVIRIIKYSRGNRHHSEGETVCMGIKRTVGFVVLLF